MIKILDETSVNQKIKRISWEILEHNSVQKEIFFIGIGERGGEIANQLANNLSKISNINTKYEKFYLDKRNPYDKDKYTEISRDKYTGKVVVLCDDVLNSGRTLIFAAKYFLEVPLAKLSTVVLVDRNHNLYPIKSDYVGLSLATTLKEYISVQLKGPNKGVYIS